ncbi:TPA: UTP--glucose-1-phosphate uridylyltransferase, partial [Listeria monocytogenes]|nr:UTP--glucose-1-phosphate uridylyltransferase [Listeria monocytogenes]
IETTLKFALKHPEIKDDVRDLIIRLGDELK